MVVIYLLWLWISPRRALRKATSVPIAEVGEGARVKIRGTVRVVSEALVAPASERPCVAWHLIAQQSGSTDGSAGDSVMQIVDEKRGQPFYVEDGTGRALVHPGDAFNLLIEKDGELHNIAGSSGVAGVEQRLRDDYGIALKKKGRVFSIKFREGVIEEGETVAVIANATWEAAAEGSPDGYRSPPKVLVMRDRGKPGTEVIISDDPSTTER